MNCTVLQRRLLHLEEPHRPPAELRAHLARCPACRDWQRRLTELEERVPLLPVPPSTAKARLIERVLADTPVPGREPPAVRPTLPFRPGTRRRDVARKKVALAVALVVSLAATVVLMVLPNWPVNPTTPATAPPATYPLLRSLLNHDLDLAHWSEQNDRRFDLLEAVAKDLHDEVNALAEDGTDDDWNILAQCYERVLQDGIGPVAGTAPADRRTEFGGWLAKARAEIQPLAEKAAGERGQYLQRMAVALDTASRALGAGRHVHVPAPWPNGFGLARFARPSAGHRVLPGSVPVLALALLAEASPGAASSQAAERARRFGRNRELVQKLVDGGVRLARESNSLRRAACCSGLAESLAEEIRKAAQGAESARVQELGGHLCALLEKGVASNLGDARAHIPLGSADEQQLQTVEHGTETLVNSLDTDLQRARGVQDVADVRKRMHDANEALQDALRVRPAP